MNLAKRSSEKKYSMNEILFPKFGVHENRFGMKSPKIWFNFHGQFS